MEIGEQGGWNDLKEIKVEMRKVGGRKMQTKC